MGLLAVNQDLAPLCLVFIRSMLVTILVMILRVQEVTFQDPEALPSEGPFQTEIDAALSLMVPQITILYDTIMAQADMKIGLMKSTAGIRHPIIWIHKTGITIAVEGKAKFIGFQRQFVKFSRHMAG